MKSHTLFLFILPLILAACKSDPYLDPNPNENTEVSDSIQMPVKKYLTKQLYNDDPNRVILSIDWNEDCSKINHIRHGLGIMGNCVDYDFKYYNNDSICITFSLQPLSYPLWAFWYDSVILHLQNNRIDSICCYEYDSLQHVEHYYYDERGRLTERSYLFGTKDSFHWEEENVTEAYMFLKEYEYKQFTNFYHPHYNLPFYLSNYISSEVPAPLLKPLWKYEPFDEAVDYEVDEDNYVSKKTWKQTGNSNTFYYITPKK